MKKLLIFAIAALGMLACTDQNAPQLPSTSPASVDGELTGLFSVSPKLKVHFSQGNLQYKASSNTWRFAEKQYDYIGDNNSKISSFYNDFIDLFGWGTSGYDNKYPYMTSVRSSDYCSEKEISCTNYDWGWYNKITNGGNQTGIWRTLTMNEWLYVLGERPNASDLCGGARVNGVYGYVLLPDNWTTPSDLHWEKYTLNRYSSTEWNKMEIAGAIFLPCSGSRSEKELYYIGEQGAYWTSTRDNTDYRRVYSVASLLVCNEGGDVKCQVSMSLSNYVDSRYVGRSVRLVQDVE